jgi:glucosamine--fructose-6-phosphate aminotransferase (isomerizing)
MYVACCALAATLAQMDDALVEMSRLPDVGDRLLASTGERMKALSDPDKFDRIYFLGSGLRYGLASECSLKMKEMSLTHAEPFHFLEFRHGPISMVTDSTLVAGLLSDDPQGREAAVLRDVSELGGHVLPLGDTALPGFEHDSVSFESGLGEVARSVLYLPPLQLLGLERALAKRLNPDQPRNLQPVVYLDD